MCTKERNGKKMKKEKTLQRNTKKSHISNLISHRSNGITLIALIITIIVLLILAVVAIQAVREDGILAHAKNARDEYQKAQENEVTALKEYEDYIVEQLGAVNSENYGKKVNFKSKGTDKGDLIWRIFYEDRKNVYLISETPNKRCPVSGLAFYDCDENWKITMPKEIVKEYKSGADVSLQGQNLMPMAKNDGTVFTRDNTNYNIIATAYLCDITKWEDYTDEEGKAEWAMGSPTVELFVRSYDATQGKTTTLNVSNQGYESSIISRDTYKTDMNNGIYRLHGGWWWLASPSARDKSSMRIVDDGYRKLK